MTENNLNDMNNFTVGFVGLGLIGGSIARALRFKYPNITIIAYEHNDYLCQDNELGLMEGVLDEVTMAFDAFSPCNIIFLCAPVIHNISYLPILKEVINPDCIITDVGSVKANIHDAVSKYGLEANFIGGHPMTGSEKSGFKSSDSKLFENIYYILTATDKTSKPQKNSMTQLVKALGAMPIMLDYIEHDQIVAAISHLPHIVAASLVNLVKNQTDSRDLMKKLAAGGFRDITRIASSSPEIWENISVTNSDYISFYLNEYINLLQGMAKALNKKDRKSLYNTFSSAKDYRNELPEKSQGMLGRIHEIYMDIDDEAGAIAMVATLLASNHISIKNIGIIHNREFNDGVLRIEFYKEDAQEHATDLLRQRGYIVYERE